MTDKNTAKNDAQRDTRRPDMIAYHVKPIGNDNAIWTAVGAAWLNKDQTSYSMQLDALPLGGRVQLHPRKEDADK